MRCHNPIDICNRNLGTRQKVPCGRCIYCLETNRSVWTFRILQEMKEAKSARFITLTYNEENLPYVAKYGKDINYKKVDTIWELPEEIGGHKAHYVEPTLRKEDLTGFIKRLRARIMDDRDKNEYWYKMKLSDENKLKWSPTVRYFAAAEYGKRGTERPHYHVILYNVPLKYYKADLIHREEYSPILEELWGKGHIDIQDVTRKSAHYVAKYTIKSIFENWDNYDDRQKPYATMSRNPGIGNNYLNDEQIRNYFNRSENSYTRLASGHKQAIGRFYKDRLWKAEDITDGISIWPRERKVATKKAKDFGLAQERAFIERKIEEEEGDIQAGEERAIKEREEAFKRAQQKVHKQLKQRKL